RPRNPLTNQVAITTFEYLITGSIDLNVEVPDLLSQRITVKTQEVGRPNLIAAGRRERCREQRHLDLLEDAMVEARRWHAVGKTGEVRGQIGFDRTTEIIDALLHTAARS